ncbi:hypothetical protein FIU93_06530 [Labrenzia sp. THAF35]|uniref:hypothetical protein n=1 Tax=Labrenzia sp. THAF35 TaxID=2587854 RepID=UPI001267ED9C|nr:hypothetical protein [Labrenzia sp. THAF35]QFT66425.1 hypothetical protein FIU93_06530 [Labrenzia sp. THAF35]
MLGRYASFSDESSTQHHYTVIGGILCKDVVARQLRQVIIEAQTGSRDTLKWSKIRAANKHRYEKVVDAAFEAITSHRMDFHSLVVAKSDEDHDTFNNGDSELGFNKFVVQHLYGFKRKLGKHARIRHMYAARTSPHDLTKFESYIDGMARKRFGISCAPCLAVDHVDYRKDRMFWIADILIGAIGASYNNLLNQGSAKEQIAERIRISANLPSLTQETPEHMRHFKIWKFRPS